MKNPVLPTSCIVLLGLSLGVWASIADADEEAPAEDDLLALDELLTRLAAEDPEAADVVKLRYFAGLSVEEAAESLGMSRATAYRHWTFARAWLLQELAGDEPD